MSQTEVQLIKDAVIVNADVSNSAAIDVSKISGAMPLAGGSFTDDVTFTGASANVTFDKSSNEFLFADNAKASFGNNGDMVIKHTGSNSLIEDVGQGNLEIQTNSSILLQKGTSEFLAKFISDGAVELYHDNTLRAYTTNVGLHVDTIVSVSDNGKFRCGNGDDLEIYHDGTNSYIASNQGELRLTGANGTIRIRPTTAEDSIVAAPNAGVELYHNNTKMIETTSTGTSMPDGKFAKFGASDDITIGHNTSNYITYTGADFLITGDNTNQVKIMPRSDEPAAVFKPNAEVELYYDNSLKFETTSYGISVSGEIRDDRGNIRDIQSEPLSGSHSSRTLVEADAGKVVIMNGNLTLPSASGGGPFGGGSTLTILNKSGSAITLTQGTGLTLYNTADATTGNRTLAGRGIATVYYLYGGNEAYISGSGLS